MSENLPSTMKANRRIADQTCPVCKTTFRLGTDVRICQSCGQILHQSCWTHSGGCPECAKAPPVSAPDPEPVPAGAEEVIGQAPTKIDQALQAVVANKRAGLRKGRPAPPLPKYEELKGRPAAPVPPLPKYDELKARHVPPEPKRVEPQDRAVPPAPKHEELRCVCGEPLIRQMITCPQCGRRRIKDDSGSTIQILGAFLIAFIPAIPVAFVTGFIAVGIAAMQAANVHLPPSTRPNMGKALLLGLFVGFAATYAVTCSIMLIRCFRRM